jgi:hypothetical protein
MWTALIVVCTCFSSRPASATAVSCASSLSHIKIHVDPATCVAVAATSPRQCCSQCVQPKCATWSFGWGGSKPCHLSPKPPLNCSASSKFFGGNTTHTPPSPSPPAPPPPPPSPPAAGTQPHIIALIADDLGYANVGYLRAESNSTVAEVHTPNIDSLVASGIQLSRNYVYRFCSPSRCRWVASEANYQLDLIHSACLCLHFLSIFVGSDDNVH